ncbi:MAG: N-acetylmuramoyl-L-alanine amidase [Deltaproteobacteria bacterium]|nr:N-acetylmuramoyl-L-alanine amidase [Deltaproteobacteria bacterium]
MTRALPLVAVTAALIVSCAGEERRVLRGDSPLVTLMNDAAVAEQVPAELIAALAWVETGLRPAPLSLAAEAHGDHVPRAVGVMGLPEEGVVRSVARAARVLEVAPEAIAGDRLNVLGAAAILRQIADELYGPGALAASGSRERWLRVAARYFDAGAAGEALALDARRTIAQGLVAVDANGGTLVIPSFAELYPERNPFGASAFALTPDYARATWVPADRSNYTSASRTGADIDVVVVHTVEGTYAGAISWFRNPSSDVSAHYVIRRSDGAITQMVQHKDVAWHAGNSSYNRRSIGIEHEGYLADRNNFTPAMLGASAALTRWLSDTLGIPIDRSHIIGHIEVPGATHTDPGPHFPWTEYLDRIRNGTSTPPPVGVGTLQGVVFANGDTARRLPGATVRLSPGGQAVVARADDAFWSFSVAPGTYTVTAEAAGYAPSSVTRSVSTGAEVWGSVSLAPSAGSGILRGVVYDARQNNLDTRVPGATVTLSNGASMISGAEGDFEFTLAPGSYTISVTKTGWQPGTNQRQVVAGGVAWGSTGIVPEGVTPPNRAPQLPALVAPVMGQTSRAVRPTFTVDGLFDADGDAITLEVEIYADAALTATISIGRVATGAQARLISWQHPIDDLPRDAALYWRVAAADGQAASGWSEPARFRTPADGTAPVASSAWTASPLPGVGIDAPPSAPQIRDPIDEAVLGTVRPRFTASAATDPEGDVLAYQFQVGVDDLFSGDAPLSPLLEGLSDPGWTLDHDLAPGGRYYVRVRAADQRSYSSWSAPVTFSISPDAVSGSEEEPRAPNDRGGAIEIEAHLEPEDGGCAAVSPRPSGSPVWLLVAWQLAGLWRRRRRAS